MFSFEISITGDISLILLDVEQKIKKGGGTFVGNREFGNFSGKYKKALFSGIIEGNYKVNGDKVVINITKSTGVASQKQIEDEIREYFKPK